MSDAISYTAATGKRPGPDNRDDPQWAWFEEEDETADEDDLPTPIFERLAGGVPTMSVNRPEALWHDYPTESAALKAADDAYLRAVADGAMAAIELASRPDAG